MDTQHIIKCPACGSKMTKVGNDIEIDVCDTCGAKFLDSDEIKRLQNMK